MEVRPLSWDDALYVARHMRDADRRELYALRWDDRPETIAAAVMASPENGWVMALDGVPVAVVGALPMWPGVWSVYFFATPDLTKIQFSLTRHVKKVMMPALLEAGAHRVECHSLKGRDDTQAWLRALGARQQEGELVDYGRNRETFLIFYWTRTDVSLSPEG
jgi:hypothetical protein